MKSFLKEKLTKEIFELIEKKQLICKYFLLDKETFNENYNKTEFEIKENSEQQESNNINFWKNVDEDLIGSKLFPDERMDIVSPDTGKQSKFFEKNFNQKSYSDLRNNFGIKK